MTKQRICLVTTSYSFFLYLLKFGYNEDDIFIFTGLFPKEISKNLNHIQLPLVVFDGGPLIAPLNSLKGIWENIKGYATYFSAYIKLRTQLYFKTRNKETEVYGHANTPFSYMFFTNENVYLIEDGLMNYTPDIRETHKINPIIDKFLHLCGIYFLNAKETLGTHKNTKKVYLTRQNNHPLIKDKVEVMDIDNLWKNKTEKEKSELLDIFNLDYSLIKNLDNDCVLILTQPLTEDNYTEMEEELKIYNEIIQKYQDKNIILKPHPRERKDYDKLFPQIKRLPQEFPIELLNLIGFKPKIVASVMTTAILNFKDSEIDIYDGPVKSERLDKVRNNLKETLTK